LGFLGVGLGEIVARHTSGSIARGLRGSKGVTDLAAKLVESRGISSMLFEGGSAYLVFENEVITGVELSLYRPTREFLG